MEARTLQVAPAASIALRRYAPTGAASASVVIGGAMGVRQAYYEDFARWLAGQGMHAWTFDYRGSGDSRGEGSLRGFEADLLDWARDYEAVVDAARAAAPDQPLYLLGHSLGAQLPGFFQRPEQVDGLVSIAAGSGYWRENAPKLKRSVLYFWYVLVPLATRLWGYFPGRKLVMTLAGTRSLVGLYKAAPSAVERIAPADVQVQRIGHFGFFRTQFSQSLWPALVERLQKLSTLGVAQTTA